MATIYRFIVENRESVASTGRSSVPSSVSTKTTAKKGKYVSLLTGTKGGVEHNRKMRAINPLLNRATGGNWEKGTRLTRASLGLVKVNSATGALALSGVSIAIIIAFVIQALIKWQDKERQKADKLNAQNYKQLENGVGGIHGQYKISQNIITGRIKYNENK